MKFLGKYVFFFCDECELLTPVIKLFTQLYPSVSVHLFSNLKELISKMKANTPELILVYLSKPGKNHMAVVKDIRKNVRSSSIPVMVYQQLPAEVELRDLFKKVI